MTTKKYGNLSSFFQSQLTDEIKASSVSQAHIGFFNYMSSNEIEIRFENTLSAGDITALDTVMANHIPPAPIPERDIKLSFQGDSVGIAGIIIEECCKNPNDNDIIIYSSTGAGGAGAWTCGPVTSGIEGPAGPNGPAGPTGPTGAFTDFGYGDLHFFQYGQSLGVSTTTSNTYKNKIVVTTPTLDAGDYKICATFNWQEEEKKEDFKARILVDNVEIATIRCQPSDKGHDQYYPAIIQLVHNLTSAVHTVKLQYCSSKNKKLARISQAYMEIVRIN